MSTTTVDRFGYDTAVEDTMPTPDPGGSALFPSAPLHARTQQRKRSNLPLMIGVPLAIVAAGALVWMTAPRGVAPSDQSAQPVELAAAKLTPPLEPATTPSHMVAPTPTPAPAAPAQMAQAKPAAPAARTAPAPARKTAPARAAVRAAAPDAGSASSNASATVTAPAPNPVIAEPAPLNIPAPTVAPAPAAPEPISPM